MINLLKGIFMQIEPEETLGLLNESERLRNLLFSVARHERKWNDNFTVHDNHEDCIDKWLFVA